MTRARVLTTFALLALVSTVDREPPEPVDIGVRAINSAHGSGDACVDCNTGDPGRRLDSVLQPGDVLLIEGTSILSRGLTRIVGDLGPWTHVAVAVSGADGGLDLVHACPHARGHPRGGVERVRFAAFFRDRAPKAVMILRPREPGHAELTAARAQSFGPVPFDYAFDTGDADAMYCTELVLRALGYEDRPAGLASRGRPMRAVAPGDLLDLEELRHVHGPFESHRSGSTTRGVLAAATHDVGNRQRLR